MTDGPPRASRAGRKRDPEVDRRVLDAAREMVAEVGVRGASVSAIAQRAVVGKPSVYLRWPNLSGILVAAIADLRTPLAHIRGDSLEHSLLLACDDDHAALVRGPHLGFLSAALYEGSTDPAVGRELRTSILGPRRDRVLDILRADPTVRESGDGRLEAVANMLHAPILHDLALRSASSGHDLAASVSSVVHGIRPRPATAG